MSVSPFYVAYAQEARPYSLWTMAILVMGASFIRAIRINNYQSWLIYGLSLIFNFYTSLFSFLIAIAQGFYLLFIKSSLKPKVIKNYLLILLCSLIAFSPWLFNIIQNLSLMHDNTSWMRRSFNLVNTLRIWIRSILLVFQDLSILPNVEPIKITLFFGLIIILLLGLCILFIFDKSPMKWWRFFFSSPSLNIFLLFFIIPFIFFDINSRLYDLSLDFTSAISITVKFLILTLLVYSCYFLIVNALYFQWLFIISLSLPIPFVLLLIDIITQGNSTIPRYLIPWQLGIQIAVAYTLANNLKHQYYKVAKNQVFWQIVTLILLNLGIFSCTYNLHQTPTFQKGRNIHNPNIAKIINQSPSPLVLVEPNNTIYILSLVHSLSSQTKFKVISSVDFVPNQFNNFEDIFLLKPSPELNNKLHTDSSIFFQKVYKTKLSRLDLWQITLAR